MRAKQFLREAYIAFELSAESRAELLKHFPPKYPDVIAHHITYAFGVPKDSELPENPEHVEVVGYADDGKSLEALVVAINGSTERPDGKVYHITWSLDRGQGRKPVQSNDLIAENGFEKVNPIHIKVTPKLF